MSDTLRVGSTTLVLASASPARLATLRHAGIEPLVLVSGVDEEGVVEPTPAALAATLARLKAEAVCARITRGVDGAGESASGCDWPSGRLLVLGCDSVLEMDGTAFGKPGTAAVASARLRAMRGRSGWLHTGHDLVDLGMNHDQRSPIRHTSAVGSTRVDFADLDEAEIDAYVATGEPLQVAGAFTLDGLGGAFVTSIEGDPHNVVGVSLPLLRTMVRELGVTWPSLWARRTAGVGRRSEDPPT